MGVGTGVPGSKDKDSPTLLECRVGCHKYSGHVKGTNIGSIGHDDLNWVYYGYTPWPYSGGSGLLGPGFDVGGWRKGQTQAQTGQQGPLIVGE